MTDSRSRCNRRGFLKICAGASAALLQLPAFAAFHANRKRELSLFNTHTGERLITTYWTPDGYSPAALRDINRLLRDHRTGDTTKMDLKMLDLLHAIGMECGADKELHIISGYRCPKTNAMLRKRSKGVAKRSYHMLGMAVDLRMPEIRTNSLRKIAVSLKGGGVGYYPRSGFIHVDSGPLRTW